MCIIIKKNVPDIGINDLPKADIPSLAHSYFYAIVWLRVYSSTGSSHVTAFLITGCKAARD